MKPLIIRGMLGIALVGTLVAGYFAPDPQDAAVVPVTQAGTTTPGSASVAGASAAPATAPGAQRSAAVRDTEVLTIRPRILDDESKTVFQIDQWKSAIKEKLATSNPADLLPPPPPPPPQAPPLPFKALGRYVDDGKTKFFLQYNDQSLAVQVGDSIADLYQVENFNGGVLTLLYIPLNQKQTLDFGADK